MKKKDHILLTVRKGTQIRCEMQHLNKINLLKSNVGIVTSKVIIVIHALSPNATTTSPATGDNSELYIQVGVTFL